MFTFEVGRGVRGSVVVLVIVVVDDDDDGDDDAIVDGRKEGFIIIGKSVETWDGLNEVGFIEGCKDDFEVGRNVQGTALGEFSKIKFDVVIVIPSQ